MTPADADRAARRVGLAVLGGLNTPEGHPLRPGTAEAVLLLGPDEPAFWDILRASAEWRDGAPDPVDRWSVRVGSALAAELGAEALFPFGGPPWQPFIGWATASGCAVPSPVTLLVHAARGLFVSFRCALAFPVAMDIPPAPPRPCETCARPCETACPPRALTTAGYDVAACHAWLDRPEGRECREGGCLVRRACPVGAELRLPAQSAHHMAAFHP
ncbi:hypothetical protein [Wenxinia marina]|uniref:4Fe-4S ferredoxin-type domain-containing protein n=1 Tax=Wenxinia marina DSM 24838 TaxID=1123501 RepID=A0A0D0QEH1_9RHOB|nr:hypothetical protein [Wenxinia marina]KIQ70722.1 hypothetical protein Wenmar_01100 [Wenxinia marina DSM 24838]GGL51122.1 hypothetical protein GCM10011392_01540 [Wenxinia marina]